MADERELSLMEIAERDHPQRMALARAIVRLEASPNAVRRPRRRR